MLMMEKEVQSTPVIRTYELGPRLNWTAPNFTIRDHARQPHQLNNLVGNRGLILGFIGDLWQQASMQRIIWLQRHSHSFIRLGYTMALLVCDDPDTLYGFHVSSRVPPPFPMLSDMNGDIHATFNMSHYPGLVLLDQQRTVRHKWLVPDDRVWPKIQDIMGTLETF